MEKFILDEERVKSCIDNYKRIKEDVMETAVKSGRSENDVRLMCVTKTVEPEYINPVLDLGADLIGENRVQEYCSKLETLHLDGVEKHIIGHLQTNKVKYIAGRVDMIESVDSIKLAKEISKEFKKADDTANVLVEVNIGKEESKRGCDIEELEDLLYQKKNIRLNVDGANAAILSDLGFDPKLGLGVFIIGRVPGIIAHIHEETIDEDEFRRFCDIDDIVYDGPGR